MDQIGRVVIYDNFETGRLEHFGSNEFIANAHNLSKIEIVSGSVNETDFLKQYLDECHLVFHAAANSQIAKAASEPSIDFNYGPKLTSNLLEAMRTTKCKNIVFFSGSGVYGVPKFNILGKAIKFKEDSPLNPISTYGASKISSESLIKSYSYMFDINILILRMANIVGPFQTHGVTFDLVKKFQLMQDFNVLGNGEQVKPFLHTIDLLGIIQKIVFNNEGAGGDNLRNLTLNVSNFDELSIRDLVNLICKSLHIDFSKIKFSDQERGWIADVPRYRLDMKKLNNYGFDPIYNSKQAVIKAIEVVKNEKF
jgi:UDP-glucose 4-epimerase